MFDCFTEPPVAHVQNNDDDDGGPVEGQGIMGESVLAKKNESRGNYFIFHKLSKRFGRLNHEFEL